MIYQRPARVMSSDSQSPRGPDGLAFGLLPTPVLSLSRHSHARSLDPVSGPEPPNNNTAVLTARRNGPVAATRSAGPHDATRRSSGVSAISGSGYPPRRPQPTTTGQRGGAKAAVGRPKEAEELAPAIWRSDTAAPDDAKQWRLPLVFGRRRGCRRRHLPSASVRLGLGSLAPSHLGVVLVVQGVSPPAVG